MQRTLLAIAVVCCFIVLLQCHFHSKLAKGQSQIDLALATSLDARNSLFLEKADHASHVHASGGHVTGGAKSIQDIQLVVDRLAGDISARMEADDTFYQKLHDILEGDIALGDAGSIRDAAFSIPITEAPERTQCNPLEPDLLFYNRIGKAGSSTMNNWIKHELLAIGLRANFGSDSESLGNSPAREKAEIKRMVNIGSSPKVYISHMYFLDLEKFGYVEERKNMAYMNQMRQPGERYISQYYFWRQLRDPFGKDCNDLGITIEECIEKSRHGTVYTCPMRNYQTAYFCGHGPECTLPPTEQSFQIAKKHLIEEYATVGIMEEMELFTRVLRKKFPTLFTVEGDLNHMMKTDKPKTASDQTLIDKATELNDLDMRLYEVARDLFHKQAAACGLM